MSGGDGVCIGRTTNGGCGAVAAGQQVLFKAPVIPDLRVDSAVQLQFCCGRAFAEMSHIHGELLSPLSGLNPLLSTASGMPSLPAVIPTAAPTTSGASWPNAVILRMPSNASDCWNHVVLPCASRHHFKRRSKARPALWRSAACWNVLYLHLRIHTNQNCSSFKFCRAHTV